MDIIQMCNLWYAKNEVEKYSIFLLADDEQEAMEVALAYFNNSAWTVNSKDITIIKFNDVSIKCDCDYIISKDMV